MFGKRKKNPIRSYDPTKMKPVIRVSICTGEKTAGFKNLETGHFSEVCLVRGERDLEQFRTEYGIQGEIEEIY